MPIPPPPPTPPVLRSTTNIAKSKNLPSGSNQSRNEEKPKSNQSACKVCAKPIFNELMEFHMINHSCEILPWLYLGGIYDAKNYAVLKSKGINCILNVTKEVDNFFPDENFQYQRIAVEDDPNEDLASHFSTAFEFIESARSETKNILVHCVEGKSRSVSIVISYLMKTKQWNLTRCLDYVKDKRPIANPNPGFIKQLERLQLDLKIAPFAEINSCAPAKNEVNEKKVRLEKIRCRICGSNVIKELFPSHKTSHGSEIIPGLFLGGERNAKNLPELKMNEIKKILNVSWEAANFYPEEFSYKRLEISDYGHENIGELFQKAFDFIDGESHVLVHCVQGISRSATIVIAYLMKKYQWNLQKALEHVKEKREIVHPNPGFIKQLEQFQQQLNV